MYITIRQLVEKLNNLERLKPDTKQKYLYRLTDVNPVPGFVPEWIRHGRTWVEITTDN